MLAKVSIFLSAIVGRFVYCQHMSPYLSFRLQVSTRFIHDSEHIAGLPDQYELGTSVISLVTVDTLGCQKHPELQPQKQ
jgi:hypothetical protein